MNRPQTSREAREAGLIPLEEAEATIGVSGLAGIFFRGRHTGRPFDVVEFKGLPVRTLLNMRRLTQLRHDLRRYGIQPTRDTMYSDWFFNGNAEYGATDWEGSFEPAFDGYEESDVLSWREAEALTGIPFNTLARSSKMNPARHMKGDCKRVYFVSENELKRALTDFTGAYSLARRLIDRGRFVEENKKNKKLARHVNNAIRARQREKIERKQRSAF